METLIVEQNVVKFKNEKIMDKVICVPVHNSRMVNESDKIYCREDNNNGEKYKNIKKDIIFDALELTVDAQSLKEDICNGGFKLQYTLPAVMKLSEHFLAFPERYINLKNAIDYKDDFVGTHWYNVLSACEVIYKDESLSLDEKLAKLDEICVYKEEEETTPLYAITKGIARWGIISEMENAEFEQPIPFAIENFESKLGADELINNIFLNKDNTDKDRIFALRCAVGLVAAESNFYQKETHNELEDCDNDDTRKELWAEAMVKEITRIVNATANLSKCQKEIIKGIAINFDKLTEGMCEEDYKEAGWDIFALKLLFALAAARGEICPPKTKQ